jgi:hypothetical protein
MTTTAVAADGPMIDLFHSQSSSHWPACRPVYHFHESEMMKEVRTFPRAQTLPLAARGKSLAAFDGRGMNRLHLAGKIDPTRPTIGRRRSNGARSSC